MLLRATTTRQVSITSVFRGASRFVLTVVCCSCYSRCVLGWWFFSSLAPRDLHDADNKSIRSVLSSSLPRTYSSWSSLRSKWDPTTWFTYRFVLGRGCSVLTVSQKVQWDSFREASSKAIQDPDVGTSRKDLFIVCTAVEIDSRTEQDGGNNPPPPQALLLTGSESFATGTRETNKTWRTYSRSISMHILDWFPSTRQSVSRPCAPSCVTAVTWQQTNH